MALPMHLSFFSPRSAAVDSISSLSSASSPESSWASSSPSPSDSSFSLRSFFFSAHLCAVPNIFSRVSSISDSDISASLPICLSSSTPSPTVAPSSAAVWNAFLVSSSSSPFMPLALRPPSTAMEMHSSSSGEKSSTVMSSTLSVSVWASCSWSMLSLTAIAVAISAYVAKVFIVNVGFCLFFSLDYNLKLRAAFKCL